MAHQTTPTQPDGDSKGRRRKRRIVLGSIAALALIGASAVWLGGANSNQSLFDRVRLGWDEKRRALDQRRRAWEQERRASEQARRQAAQAAWEATHKTPPAAPSTNH